MKDFAEQFPALCKAAHATAVAKGWWEKPPSTETIICLIHTEISEAFEEFRKHGLDTEKFLYFERDGFGNLKPEGIAVELADVMIRLMDWCEHEGWELELPRRHGRPAEAAWKFERWIIDLHEYTSQMRSYPHTYSQFVFNTVSIVTELFDIPLEEAIRVKMAYNETRPYKHEGRVIMCREIGQGEKAYNDGQDIDANPYSRGTDEYADWDDGWNDACTEDEMLVELDDDWDDD